VLKEQALTSSFDVFELSLKVASGCHESGDAALEHETNDGRPSQRLIQLLTIREREISLLVAEGLRTRRLASAQLSEGTVKIHLHNIYQKLQVSNRTTLAALAIAHRDELPCRRKCRVVNAEKRSDFGPAFVVLDEIGRAVRYAMCRTG